MGDWSRLCRAYALARSTQSIGLSVRSLLRPFGSSVGSSVRPFGSSVGSSVRRSARRFFSRIVGSSVGSSVAPPSVSDPTVAHTVPSRGGAAPPRSEDGGGAAPEALLVGSPPPSAAGGRASPVSAVGRVFRHSP